MQATWNASLDPSMNRHRRSKHFVQSSSPRLLRSNALSVPLPSAAVPGHSMLGVFFASQCMTWERPTPNSILMTFGFFLGTFDPPLLHLTLAMQTAERPFSTTWWMIKWNHTWWNQGSHTKWVQLHHQISDWRHGEAESLSRNSAPQFVTELSLQLSSEAVHA